MRTATAHPRHRAQHTRVGASCVGNLRVGRFWSTCLQGIAAAVLGVAVTGGCSKALPRPEFAQVSADDYVAVPFTPKVPPVEFVPPSPTKGAVWVDGSWVWSGSRYGWRYGSWVVPPPGIRRARWTIVRRGQDGQLFFAPASWKDASGKTVDDRAFGSGLGPAARARSRLGAPPPTSGGTDGTGRTEEPMAPYEDTFDGNEDE